ncbi:MAG: CDP-diacylglycerol--glycerol-3-phosphate 3-phosphatidyltransferase [Candidatus Diapherotrites archaeon]|nr:CDP-diacylglycerol--glycerol-3-phosphate 3-phosphatidyltransferase [Candidatus Diapherotrites archaeon]
MNLPNKLTMFRFFSLPFIVLLMYYLDAFWAVTGALILFVIAVLTDKADGIIAKKYNLQTKFGSFMDPTSDKLMINTLFIVMLVQGFFPMWMMLLMLARELVVQGIRSMAVSEGKILKSEQTGKLKAGMQMGVIMLALILMTIYYTPGVAPIDYIPNLGTQLVYWSMALTLVVAYWAFFEFIYKNYEFIMADA